eukprot:TRINITY_DN9980_c0_g1_i1.p1 TRINITY_DN9980_c0_g1~~TRINITY_DN9980_c0_g1_i1.p1  ORF type:complete len:205 (+),score=30.20 TRINITY_DN9980_c0_g1_i1:55-669(+)
MTFLCAVVAALLATAAARPPPPQVPDKYEFMFVEVFTTNNVTRPLTGIYYSSRPDQVTRTDGTLFGARIQLWSDYKTLQQLSIFLDEKHCTTGSLPYGSKFPEENEFQDAKYVGQHYDKVAQAEVTGYEKTLVLGGVNMTTVVWVTEKGKVVSEDFETHEASKVTGHITIVDGDDTVPGGSFMSFPTCPFDDIRKTEYRNVGMF